MSLICTFVLSALIAPPSFNALLPNIMPPFNIIFDSTPVLQIAPPLLFASFAIIIPPFIVIVLSDWSVCTAPPKPFDLFPNIIPPLISTEALAFISQIQPPALVVQPPVNLPIGKRLK